MAWFKVDDQVTFSPKVLRAGNSAFGAWVRLGAYANAQLTDGFVPESVAKMVASQREVDALIVADLLRLVPGGFEIVEYHKDQPTSVEVLERREKRAEAGRAGGLASARAKRSKKLATGQANRSIEPLAKFNPDPTRPDPTRPSSPDLSTISEAPPPAPGARLELAEVCRIWEAVTGQAAIFDRDQVGVRERVEYYAGGPKAAGRSPAAIGEQAVRHFVAYRDGCSPGFKPRLSGFKFCEHWPTIEAMLDGAPLETRPQKASAGPTIVAGLNFAKKERP